MTSPYDDIIGLPRHVSRKHAQMPIADRAAQFAPFAALTGFGTAIEETARLTDERIELDESEKTVINEALSCIAADIAMKPHAVITYFLPDTRKQGGAYVEISGNVKKIDGYTRSVLFDTGESVPIDDIIRIEH